MRIVSIGDIGVSDGMIHVGDEAMFEALVDRMRQRGVEVTGLSSAPAESAARYGIDAISRIGFPRTDGSGGSVDEAERLAQVLRAADGDRSALGADDPAWGVIDAIRSSDGVVIAGGGNMASNWPMHIYERAALGRLAVASGVPLVVSGQTIGPNLLGSDRELVAELLRSAAVVGVRESASLALVRTLGVPDERLTQNPDDAAFLGGDDPVSAPPKVVAPYCLVSLSTHLGGEDRARAVAGFAEVLDRAAGLGLEVRFHAHWASLDPDRVAGDSVLHAEVRAAMSAPSIVEPTTDSRAAARLARGAQLLVTSRYHPAVFATADGVPTLGVAVDGYTTVKLTGALASFGQDAVLPIGELGRQGADLVDLLWGDREVIRSRGLAESQRQGAAADAWWDRVVAALR